MLSKCLTSSTDRSNKFSKPGPCLTKTARVKRDSSSRDLWRMDPWPSQRLFPKKGFLLQATRASWLCNYKIRKTKILLEARLIPVLREKTTKFKPTAAITIKNSSLTLQTRVGSPWAIRVMRKLCRSIKITWPRTRNKKASKNLNLISSPLLIWKRREDSMGLTNLELILKNLDNSEQFLIASLTKEILRAKQQFKCNQRQATAGLGSLMLRKQWVLLSKRRLTRLLARWKDAVQTISLIPSTIRTAQQCPNTTHAQALAIIR